MNKTSNNNLALALGGGAARGAFHLGFLHFCEKHNIQIEAYSGSSIGSIISASHASGVCAKEQLRIFASKDLKKIFKFNFFRNGLFRIEQTSKIIEELLPVKNLEELQKPVYICSYDLREKKLHYFNKGEILSLCLASSALIPLFKPVKHENMYLIDGGFFDNIPIKPLENKGYDILTIDLFPKREYSVSKKINPLRILKRNLLKSLYENHAYSKEFSTHYLTSAHIRNFSLFTFKQLEDCFNLGFKEAQNHFLDII
ncbi:patatin [Malaciobacter molluscorum LMG 25693]|uniref:Patatin n=1 Tax=Malaciobacter molluscorum LMG 25693 TaxID=870501 RepID=A0A2G1DFS5_9BACT|nr:patatin-like phospholipase family protein [Malaciobacter molluscorum]AXX93633.1 Patatin-like phospholipase [Malaciobacter molluscorum LMG 25693]PHO17339.1 patatin [Malaciobacter molluscorum LMG 25693]RXJ92548.1 patatin [Malaciobacter molluscorum]